MSIPHQNSTIRQEYHRIFVNRSLQLEKIRFYGFDMDYTLAIYKSPDFEELCFTLTRDVLITNGYPECFKNFKYESFFPLRGLWFDRDFGTFLKTDQYGNILFATIGFKYLKTHEVLRLYPNKFMKFDETRIYVMNTLFSLSEMYLLAQIIHWFNNNDEYIVSDTGVTKACVFMSYKSIMQDVRDATDDIHDKGSLKSKTIERIDKYLSTNSKLASLLKKIQNSGAKTFLLTNSGYNYTQKIMSYILSNPDKQHPALIGDALDWTTYFDYIVVDAKKPKFFLDGSILRELNKESGRATVGQHIGPMETGKIYSGGSCELFSKLIGSRGKDVLYVGDHIFGDILKSKKIVGWRTCLIIPELNHELGVWREEQHHYNEIIRLDNHLEEIYSYVDINSAQKPNVKSIKDELKEHAKEMELSYGALGSMFRNGSRLTFFSSQVQRYADLYTSSCTNFLYYPLCYMFRSMPSLLPHELNVGGTLPMELSVEESEIFSRAKPTENQILFSRSQKSNSITSDDDESKQDVITT